jgi:formylglycine-generating enzyme required for sulfatase activity
MIGNIREWTSDWYSIRRDDDAPKACGREDPRVE